MADFTVWRAFCARKKWFGTLCTLSFAFVCFRLLSLAFVLLLIICNMTHTALGTERTCGNLLHKRQRNRKLGLEGRFAGIKHIFKPGPVKPSTSRFVSWPIKPPSFY